VQVKKTSADDTDLYWWIRDQRTKFKHKKLPPEQAIHKKTKIDFFKKKKSPVHSDLM